MRFESKAVQARYCGNAFAAFRRVTSVIPRLSRLPTMICFPLGMMIMTGCGTVVYRTSTQPAQSCKPASPSANSPTCPVLTPVAGMPFSGKVVAGSQPVMGASLQLYAAGNSGNGSAPAALLPNTLTSAADGSFAVPGGYSCPSSQTPIYLISKAGKPANSTTANPGLWLMAALGPCGKINPGSNVVLNEVTTASSVWALAPFMSSGGTVGASCTNTVGLDNAFLTARSLVNLSTGASPGAVVSPTVTIPAGKLNTLANALASCTGSDGGDACSELFSASIAGSVQPTNTVDAALNIARAPGNNVASIYALAAGTPAFSPALSAAPPDWTLPITITGGGMSLPASIAISDTGNVWVSSYFNAVSEFLPDGSPAFPAGITGSGINQSYGMALDPSGNVWIANEQTAPNSGTGNVAELDASGNLIANGITSGGIDFPIAAAADSNSDVWFVDYGSSRVTLLDKSGSALSGTLGWGGGFLTFPVALAVDSNHNAWVANQSGKLPVTRISSDGSQITNFDCDCNGASGIAIDQNDNVWLANYYGNSISEVNTCGSLVLDAATGGGVQHPQGIAIDGVGTAWVTNYTGNSLSKITNASGAAQGVFASPSSGFGMDAALNQPYGLAIDASGNIWVSNSGNNTLTQFVGIATPVKTPLAGPPKPP
jgi:hypothetical protein